jgi:hypothetical protein
MYKFAAQKKLTFPSRKGELTVSDLFDLPLKSQTEFDLDTVAKAINAQLKGASEESFVEEAAADPKKEALSVALAVVKDVIATKQEENKAARLKLERAAERRKLLDAISAKKDQALTAASLDDLEKKLAALDG